MSFPSPLPATRFEHCNSHLRTFEKQHSMFGSIKKKLSRRGSNPLTSSRSNPSNMPKSKSPPRGLASNNPFSNPSNEPPPAYTPVPAAGPSAPYTTPSADTADDPYAFLAHFDTVFLIDDSTSMTISNRWQETEAALQAITPICTERDADGIDIYFLNHPDSPLYKNVKLPSTVVEIFQNVRPRGATFTGLRIDAIMRPYLSSYAAAPETHKPKPLNLIVITDGDPSDDLETAIVNIADKLDALDAPSYQVGIQFFQVGNDPQARESLKRLDDEMAEFAGRQVRDIVDTVPWAGEDGAGITGRGILKVVLGSVNRKLDRSSKELHRKV